MYAHTEQLKPAEMKTIANVYNDKNAAATAQAEGIHVAGTRYVVARIVDRTIYARSVSDIPF